MTGEARVDLPDEQKWEKPITSVLTVGIDRDLTEDEKTLITLGYKPELRREFSLWTTFSVSFAVLGLLPSLATTLYYVCKKKKPPSFFACWQFAPASYMGGFIVLC